MIYFHGGAYIGGTGGAPFYDGTKLAEQDIVAVTCNHRLNLFGFLYLGDLGGAKYADSGNASMLDLVLALQWIRDNIAQFGGDPNNVTIFGESGGGSKVSVMTAMPAGAGLFHKAAVQSGSALRARTREEATRATERVLADLGLKTTQLDELHKLTDRLLAASAAGGGFDRWSMAAHGIIRTIPNCSSISARVPIIGSTKQETVYSSATAIRRVHLTRRAGDPHFKAVGDAQAADTLFALYRKQMPNARRAIVFEITTGSGSARTRSQAERKAGQGGRQPTCKSLPGSRGASAGNAGVSRERRALPSTTSTGRWRWPAAIQLWHCQEHEPRWSRCAQREPQPRRHPQWKPYRPTPDDFRQRVPGAERSIPRRTAGAAGRQALRLGMTLCQLPVPSIPGKRRSRACDHRKPATVDGRRRNGRP